MHDKYLRVLRLVNMIILPAGHVKAEEPLYRNGLKELASGLRTL